MTTTLKNYLVAFIDILGFKEMVRHDSEVPDGQQKFINILYTLHLQTKEIKDSNPEIQVFQFSDSVVISMPYSASKFIDFCEIISNYQYRLFLSGILCRGGISYGKHFSSDSFIFSTGMIHAYLIESKEAITPRVVISKDLIDLVFPENNIKKNVILKESDSLHFINYFINKDQEETHTALKSIIPSDLHPNASIRQKQIWLIDYFNFCFPDMKFEAIEKFSAH